MQWTDRPETAGSTAGRVRTVICWGALAARHTHVTRASTRRKQDGEGGGRWVDAEAVHGHRYCGGPLAQLRDTTLRDFAVRSLSATQPRDTTTLRYFAVPSLSLSVHYTTLFCCRVSLSFCTFLSSLSLSLILYLCALCYFAVVSLSLHYTTLFCSLCALHYVILRSLSLSLSLI